MEKPTLPLDMCRKSMRAILTRLLQHQLFPKKTISNDVYVIVFMSSWSCDWGFIMAVFTLFQYKLPTISLKLNPPMFVL